MSGMSFCLTEGPFALPEDAMRSTAATFPRIVAVEGLSEETIFVLPGPRQVSRITDARTGKTYEVGESLEDYARRCMVIKNVTSIRVRAPIHPSNLPPVVDLTGGRHTAS